MLVKSLETGKFVNYKLALFKIWYPDSVRVKILNLDPGRYCRAKFWFFQFFLGYPERRFEKFRFLRAETADSSDSDDGSQILSFLFQNLN